MPEIQELAMQELTQWFIQESKTLDHDADVFHWFDGISPFNESATNRGMASFLQSKFFSDDQEWG